MTDSTTQRQSEHPEPGAIRYVSRRRLLQWLVLIMIGLALVFWIGRWVHHQQTHVAGDDARVMTQEVTVSSRLPGRITDFSRIVGDDLARGDVVARLYDRPAALQLEQLQARVKQAKAQIALEQQQVALASSQLSSGIEETADQLQADLSAVTAAKAAMDQARKTYERSALLFKSGQVSGQKKDEDYYTYEAAKAEYEHAQRQVKVDRSALENAHNGMMAGSAMTLPKPDLVRARLAVTRQLLSEANAALRKQQLEISDRVVQSPVNGVVDKTFVETGEYVSPGQPLLMMHTPDNVWVEANIKETKIHSLRPGQPVSISVDAYPDQSFSGHVQVIGQAATSQFALLPNPNPSGNFTKITQRIPVRIQIDQGPKTMLSPGMMVVVDIDIRKNAGDDNQASQ